MFKHLAVVALLSLSLLGCQKAPDLGRVQKEAIAVVKSHAAQLDLLQRRADDLQRRASALPKSSPQLGEADKLNAEARSLLDQLRGIAGAAPNTIGAAAQGKDPEQLQATIDEMVEKLLDGTATIRADLDAFESFVDNTESRPRAVEPPPSALPMTPGSPLPHDAPPAGTGAGSSAGSAAPATPVDAKPATPVDAKPAAPATPGAGAGSASK